MVWPRQSWRRAVAAEYPRRPRPDKERLQESPDRCAPVMGRRGVTRSEGSFRVELSATALAFAGVGALIGAYVGSALGFGVAIAGTIVGAIGGWSVGSAIIRSRRAQEKE
ncbi:hypothetical protein CQW49_20585 [Methylosinus trichosporium OB3b]|uniref:Glycine zipper domain-containing protein n=1 Tax=Methylosinus trichosporium (strain ATCC 35070 / NCIMB 11131 / UNIQEM 75 / OB3b) TaxID=595536 RepID=A0A2D2D4X6_METT3|nr:hypothetical protein CQW49_20585 [Methylosinus trichosporium OB3b]